MAEQNNKNASIVLIVDDVEANRFVLKEIIEDMGYLPMLTENGVQALKIVERFHPQLIISDIAMPEMDGYEFCRIIKGDSATRDIPVIFISAFDEPADIVKGFTLGGEDYITKPFIPEVVKARVNLHLKLNDYNKELLEINRKLQAAVNEQLRQMELEKKNMLYTLTRVARENACYDVEHMERLSYNCRILAEAMQLSAAYDSVISDTYVETIELAAPLSDLGNVAVPTSILQKEERLTDEEWETLQKHTTIGARILRDIENNGDYNDFIHMSGDIAHYHHERWDGSGYPCGLKEKEIPLSAQIVAIVGAYCSLTEKRTYREAYTRDEALTIMEKDSGSKFNPEIFDILKKIARQLH
ncbi:MAG: response regulator [Acetatifactor sp.]|nr:response regulator [Acetatifactor sp.]